MNSRKKTALGAVIALFAFTVSVFAQTTTPTPPIKEEDQVIKVSSRLVVVPVSVTDSNGEPVSGLKAENFRVSEEGRQQVIDSVGNAENVPLEIAVLFDVSASTDAMSVSRQWPEAQARLPEFGSGSRRTVRGPADSPPLPSIAAVVARAGA